MRNEEQVARHRANAWLDYEYDRVGAHIQVSYVSHRQALDPFEFGQEFVLTDVDDQFIIDARVAYKINDQVTAELVVNNLGAQRQFLNGQGFPGVERRLWVGLRVDF